MECKSPMAASKATEDGSTIAGVPRGLGGDQIYFILIFKFEARQAQEGGGGTKNFACAKRASAMQLVWLDNTLNILKSLKA